MALLIANQTIEVAQQYYPHLQGLPLADYSRGDEELEVDIMIGEDYFWSVVQNNTVRGEVHDPVAIRTRLGYVLSGPVNVANSGQSHPSVNMSHVMKTECTVVEEDLSSIDDSFKNELSKFWDYDTLGVKEREDEFLGEVQGQVQWRPLYSVIPVEEHPVIPDNYLLARSHLTSYVEKIEI